MSRRPSRWVVAYCALAATLVVVLGIPQLAQAATYPNPGPVTGSTSVHDPSMVKTSAGGYIVVSTGPRLAIKTSTDRTAFKDAGSVWPSGVPAATTAYTNGGDLWAPDISYHGGTYYLYYAASSFGSSHSGIFLATSTTGAAGSWQDRGLVIETTSSSNYNAIDPNLFVDANGQWWLTFGSFWSGIKLIKLNSSGKRADTTVLGLAERFTNSKSVEAPFLFRHGGFYYLFVSFDLCCRGASSTYRVMVGRSASVTGPYTDRGGAAMTAGGGTEILAGHGSVHGPGHQAVIADTDADVLVYHYYQDNGASKLGINLLRWTADWPTAF
jgi:arabinan endo-1,5-alpha-L-arabinosidase